MVMCVLVLTFLAISGKIGGTVCPGSLATSGKTGGTVCPGSP